MKIRIYAKDLNLTDEIRSYVEEKVLMLGKYFGKIQNVDVEVSRILSGQHTGDVFRCEWNVTVPGKMLRVEKTEQNLYKAIDKVKDHMVREIRNYKEKIVEKKHGKL